MAAKPKNSKTPEINLSKITPTQALGFVHQGLQRGTGFSIADAQVLQASMMVLKKIVDEHDQRQKRAAKRRN